MLDARYALAARDPDQPLLVALCETRAEHRELGPHRHPRGQLSGLRRGVWTIGTDAGTWVVPADHAVWLPPHQPHSGWTHGAVDGWSCYIGEAACARLPDRPRAIRASGLLREAVLRASGWQGVVLDEAQLCIAQVILNEISTAAVEPFGLPMPRDARLLRLARALLEQPGDRRGMAQWATWAGVSERTLSRLFVVETGFSYTAWRQRARLMRALELLAEDVAVTTVAFELGYDSVSAFIALFKRTLGVTPSAYFAAG